MHDDFESTLDWAIQQSEIMDAFARPEEGLWVVECLGERLHVFVRNITAQEVMHLACDVAVPKRARCPDPRALAWGHAPRTAHPKSC